jgi:hypothetical protein
VWIFAFVAVFRRFDESVDALAFEEKEVRCLILKNKNYKKYSDFELVVLVQS